MIFDNIYCFTFIRFCLFKKVIFLKNDLTVYYEPLCSDNIIHYKG